MESLPAVLRDNMARPGLSPICLVPGECPGGPAVFPAPMKFKNDFKITHNQLMVASEKTPGYFLFLYHSKLLPFLGDLYLRLKRVFA